MTELYFDITRRYFLAALGMMAAYFSLAPHRLLGAGGSPIRRPIPSTGEQLPVIGMGTSQTFDVGDDTVAKSRLAEVLQIFFDHGGALIDSSPMYGSAEAVAGQLLSVTRNTGALFAATKVWTDGQAAGVRQMEHSMQRMGVPVMDLMQIHNLRDWQVHLPTLRQWKQARKLRYIGITTSHGRDHGELERVLRSETFDFVQFSYNIEDRSVEDRLFPLAADRGIATLINRPFQRGSLFRKVRKLPLPDWSADIDCQSWGQFFLKWIVGHPAVTCVIPATSKPRHMEDNIAAGFGRLPDAKMRRRMQQYFASL